MRKIENFRDLDIWRKAIAIVKKIYFIVERFPKNEVYGLRAQMQRAVVSIPSNIAEGFNRLHNKEYAQFLYIALGSCAELETQIEIAFELKYIDQQAKNQFLEDMDHESRMITNLIKKIKE